MTPAEKVQMIANLLLIVGMGLTAYSSWRKPQENSEKKELLLGEKFNQLRDELANLRDNHVHTLDTRLEETNKKVGDINIQLTRLNTIIEERLPKK